MRIQFEEAAVVPSCHDVIDEALSRAVVYRTLSIAFQPPTAERLSKIGAAEGFSIAGRALRGLPSEDGVLGEAAAHLAALPASAAEAAAASYWRLFGHVTRGPVCACETEYGPDNGFHQPQQLADIAGYYRAFGLRSAVSSDVRADHIACECEFMDFLSLKEALWTAGAVDAVAGDDTLDVTRQAGRSFLRDHLGRFGSAFGTRLAVEDRGGYFGTLGRVLTAFVQAECRRVGVQAGPIDLAVRAPDVDETPMACGSSSDLIQIQRRP